MDRTKLRQSSSMLTVNVGMWVKVGDNRSCWIVHAPDESQKTTCGGNFILKAIGEKYE